VSSFRGTTPSATSSLRRRRTTATTSISPIPDDQNQNALDHPRLLQVVQKARITLNYKFFDDILLPEEGPSLESKQSLACVTEAFTTYILQERLQTALGSMEIDILEWKWDSTVERPLALWYQVNAFYKDGSEVSVSDIVQATGYASFEMYLIDFVWNTFPIKGDNIFHNANSVIFDAAGVLIDPSNSEVSTPVIYKTGNCPVNAKVATTWQYSFDPALTNEPSATDKTQVICWTQYFLQSVLSSQTYNASVAVEMARVSWSFSRISDAQLTMTMDLTASTTVSIPLYAPYIAKYLDAANMQDYIENHVHQAEPVGDNAFAATSVAQLTSVVVEDVDDTVTTTLWSPEECLLPTPLPTEAKPATPAPIPVIGGGLTKSPAPTPATLIGITDPPAPTATTSDPTTSITSTNPAPDGQGLEESPPPLNGNQNTRPPQGDSGTDATEPPTQDEDTNVDTTARPATPTATTPPPTLAPATEDNNIGSTAIGGSGNLAVVTHAPTVLDTLPPTISPAPMTTPQPTTLTTSATDSMEDEIIVQSQPIIDGDSDGTEEGEVATNDDDEDNDVSAPETPTNAPVTNPGGVSTAIPGFGGTPNAFQVNDTLTQSPDHEDDEVNDSSPTEVADDEFLGWCDIMSFAADDNRNRHIDSAEYVDWINMIWKQTYLGYPFVALPTLLQENFALYAVDGEIDLEGVGKILSAPMVTETKQAGDDTTAGNSDRAQTMYRNDMCASLHKALTKTDLLPQPETQRLSINTTLLASNREQVDTVEEFLDNSESIVAAFSVFLQEDVIEATQHVLSGAGASASTKAADKNGHGNVFKHYSRALWRLLQEQEEVETTTPDESSSGTSNNSSTNRTRWFLLPDTAKLVSAGETECSTDMPEDASCLIVEIGHDVFIMTDTPEESDPIVAAAQQVTLDGIADGTLQDALEDLDPGTIWVLGPDPANIPKEEEEEEVVVVEDELPKPSKETPAPSVWQPQLTDPDMYKTTVPKDDAVVHDSPELGEYEPTLDLNWTLPGAKKNKTQVPSKSQCGGDFGIDMLHFMNTSCDSFIGKFFWHIVIIAFLTLLCCCSCLILPLIIWGRYPCFCGKGHDDYDDEETCEEVVEKEKSATTENFEKKRRKPHKGARQEGNQWLDDVDREALHPARVVETDPEGRDFPRSEISFDGMSSCEDVTLPFGKHSQPPKEEQPQTPSTAASRSGSYEALPKSDPIEITVAQQPSTPPPSGAYSLAQPELADTSWSWNDSDDANDGMVDISFRDEDEPDASFGDEGEAAVDRDISFSAGRGASFKDKENEFLWNGGDAPLMSFDHKDGDDPLISFDDGNDEPDIFFEKNNDDDDHEHAMSFNTHDEPAFASHDDRIALSFNDEDERALKFENNKRQWSADEHHNSAISFTNDDEPALTFGDDHHKPAFYNDDEPALTFGDNHHESALSFHSTLDEPALSFEEHDEPASSFGKDDEERPFSFGGDVEPALAFDDNVDEPELSFSESESLLAFDVDDNAPLISFDDDDDAHRFAGGVGM
jgi:hypothetical protein